MLCVAVLGQGSIQQHRMFRWSHGQLLWPYGWTVTGKIASEAAPLCKSLQIGKGVSCAGSAEKTDIAAVHWLPPVLGGSSSCKSQADV